MAGRIRKEDIDALRGRVDAVAVIGEHTKLQRSGARWKGLCPFHDERTPSFTVDASRNLYHCFGCGEGGDVFDFVQRLEGLTFVEAVEHLARRFGVQLHYEELSAREQRALGQRSRLVAVNDAALEFYREQLLGEAGAVAREYLKSRGFGREDAEHFRLGYAPLAWDTLARRLTGQRFAESDLLTAGVVSRNRRGGLFDRFRGRLMFPVLDVSGDVIGFGGRVVPGIDYGDDTPPKYLNTTETPLYHKSRVLYGLNWARPEVVKRGEVLVCEGYTDVMALHQSGFTNVVATCGTAAGDEHFKVLARYADRVVLAFDSDAAGAKAAERAFGHARDHDLEVRVLVLPEGEDPADVVGEGGADAMRSHVEQATPVVAFLLRRRIAEHDLATPEGRAAAVNAAAGVLAEVADPVLRHEYARREVAEPLGISLDLVGEALGRAGASLPGRVSSGAARRSRASAPASGSDAADRQAAVRRARLERDVLRVALQRPDLLGDRWYEVTLDDFTHPRARSVFAALQDAGDYAVERVLEAAPDDDVRGLVRAIALEDFTVEPDGSHVEMLVAELLLHRVEREIEWQKAELERLNPTTDPEDYRQRSQELFDLEARRRELLEAAH